LFGKVCPVVKKTKEENVKKKFGIGGGKVLPLWKFYTKENY
jgi:hypothetical protein